MRLCLISLAVLIVAAGASLDGCGETPTGNPITPNADGSVSTICGTGSPGFSGDGGPSIEAQLNNSMDLALTADGALLIADFNNNRIRHIDLATGLISTVAGDGTTAGPNALHAPSGVTVLADGGFLAVAWGSNQVFRYPPGAARSPVIGNGNTGCDPLTGQDLALNRALGTPRSADVLADGSILIGEQACHRVLRARTDGSISQYAGNGAPGYAGDNNPAVDAQLHAGLLEAGPSFGLSLSPEDPPDELFIADTQNHVIRVVKPFTGRIETYAGTGQAGFADGAPEIAQFNRPTHVFSPPDHSLWVIDAGNHAVRYIDPLRTRVTTIAGIGSPGFNGDGLQPSQTQLNSPTAVWVAPDGRVFIADSGNHRVRLFQR